MCKSCYDCKYSIFFNGVLKKCSKFGKLNISKLPKITEEEAPFIDDRSVIEKKEEDES